MEIVSHVFTNVKNVECQLPIVNHVPLEELTLQNVSVQKDIMMMVTTLNVKNVIQDVKLVDLETFVTLVKTGDLMIHMNVHVLVDSMIVLQKDLVVNVTTDVKNVLNMLIGLMEDTVLLVLMEELIIHHSVIVHMVLLNLNKFVNHVTVRDVKLVHKMLIIVILVKLTEFNLHQNVHVILDIMKMKTKIVNHVTLTVILVKLHQKTV
jgi:hypothetical protein